VLWNRVLLFKGDPKAWRVAEYGSGCVLERQENRSVYANVVINVIVDLLCLLLVNEMTDSFHHNNFLQQWHMMLESSIVYKFLRPWSSMDHVKISHNKLYRNFHRCPSPRCCELPVPTTTRL